MDTAVPQVVIEAAASCSDAGSATQALKRAIAPARAPNGGWRLYVAFRRKGGTVEATGEVRDAAGDLRSSRALVAPGTECVALSQAMGVWAVLVLDSEIEKEATPPAAPAAAPAPQPAMPAPWPAPSAPQPSKADGGVFLEHPEGSRSLEVGGGGFLLGGLGSGAVAGPTIFGVVEVGRGWFLRPMLGLGRSLTRIGATPDVYATVGLTHLDACGRIPGNYLERRGIQLDLCGGADLGFQRIDAPSLPGSTANTTPGLSGRTVPLFGAGPAIALRGELGSDLSVDLRGYAGLNVVREPFFDGEGTEVRPTWVTGRGEVGLTWRLR